MPFLYYGGMGVWGVVSLLKHLAQFSIPIIPHPHHLSPIAYYEGASNMVVSDKILLDWFVYINTLRCP